MAVEFQVYVDDQGGTPRGANAIEMRRPPAGAVVHKSNGLPANKRIRGASFYDERKVR